MWRVILVYAFICLFGIAIITKVALIQFKEGDIWRAKALTLTTQSFTIGAMRGNIYDSHENLLATSIPFYEVGIDVQTEYIQKLDNKTFENKADSLALSLSKLLKDKTRAQYLHEILTAKSLGDRYLQLARGVSFKEMQQMRKFAFLRWGRNKGGLVVVQNSKRENPFQMLALRTIGYDRTDAKPIGLEGAYESYLKGKTGTRLMKKLSGGVWMPISDENEVEPEDGADVVSTIDINVQDVAENSLMTHLAKNNADHGCAILMEVKSGAIKAIANLTRKDSGNYIESYNYAIGAATEPGSTFKLASLMAAMEDGYIDLDDTVNIGDGSCKFFNLTVKDSHHPEKSRLSVQEVFEQSSNVGVAKLINRCYQKDPQKFIDRLYRFNLNQKLGLDIAGEANPRIKNTSDKDWSGTTLPWMAYGYESLLTPMQLLAFYNAVANNGRMVRPQFVQEIRRKNLPINHLDTITINPSICSKATIEKAKKMMEGVVQNGTGKNLKTSIFPIAGKTGTAQILVNGNYKVGQNAVYQASFVGYFPANNPKYSCIVVVSAPSNGEYYGAAVAAPIFKDIADKVYSMSLDMHKEINTTEPSFAVKAPRVKPGSFIDILHVLATLKIKDNATRGDSHWASTSIQDSSTVKLIATKYETDLQKGIMPDVTGMSLQDVLFLLENKGLQVRVLGSGVVAKQSLIPGTRFTKGTTIELQLI